MSESARPRRRYDGTKRQAHAAQARRRVVAAAAEVFVEHGYTAATILRIATAAGVAVETVYRTARARPGCSPRRCRRRWPAARSAPRSTSTTGQGSAG